jgi:hypothetical protein
MSDKSPNSRRNLDLAIERVFGHSANDSTATTILMT